MKNPRSIDRGFFLCLAAPREGVEERVVDGADVLAWFYAFRAAMRMP
jgi:hypothetical protein